VPEFIEGTNPVNEAVCQQMNMLQVTSNLQEAADAFKLRKLNGGLHAMI
jgi:hypothetical protein